MRKKRKQESNLTWALYGLLAILILLYAVFSLAILGFAALILLILILFVEVKSSVKSEGLRKSAIDIGSAIAAAVVVWVLLIIVLQTTAPVDAVSSCSMLPALHRGDLIVLHGLGNVSRFVASNHVPVINVSQTAFQKMQGNMSSEFLAFFAYFGSNKSNISYTFPSSESYTIGLYNTSCLSATGFYGKQNLFYRCYVPQQMQSRNLISYSYSTGRLAANGLVFDAVYTSQISVGGASVTANYSNPIVVYQTASRDSFSGSIIHRLYAVLNVSGRYYFLTKGDNNPALDIEFGNYPVNQSDVLGYVVGDIPLLGYVKLLLSGQIATPAGCGQMFLKG